MIWNGFSPEAERLLKTLNLIENAEQPKTRQESLDYFALILATVFVPLARAEMNRMRRNIGAAINEFERMLTPYQILFLPGGEFKQGALWMICDFIERPFILLALGEIRMEKAEVQFKSASQGKADAARTTYQSIPELFKDQGALCRTGRERAEDAERQSQSATANPSRPEGCCPRVIWQGCHGAWHQI